MIKGFTAGVFCMIGLLGGHVWAGSTALKQPIEPSLAPVLQSQLQYIKPVDLMSASVSTQGVNAQLIHQQVAWVLPIGRYWVPAKARAMKARLTQQGYPAFTSPNNRRANVYIGPAVNKSTLDHICVKLGNICAKSTTPIIFRPLTMGDFDD